MLPSMLNSVVRAGITPRRFPRMPWSPPSQRYRCRPASGAGPRRVRTEPRKEGRCRPADSARARPHAAARQQLGTAPTRVPPQFLARSRLRTVTPRCPGSATSFNSGRRAKPRTRSTAVRRTDSSPAIRPCNSADSIRQRTIPRPRRSLARRPRVRPQPAVCSPRPPAFDVRHRCEAARRAVATHLPHHGALPARQPTLPWAAAIQHPARASDSLRTEQDRWSRPLSQPTRSANRCSLRRPACSAIT